MNKHLLSNKAPSFKPPSLNKMGGLITALFNGLASLRIGEKAEALSIQFDLWTGRLDSFVVRKEEWLRRGFVELKKGNVDPLTFCLMTSAMTSRHQDSGSNRMEYLRRIIRLYDAKDISEVMDVESAKQDGEEYRRIYATYASHGNDLEQAKIYCLIRDIEFGTRGKISSEEMQSLLEQYVEKKPEDKIVPRLEKTGSDSDKTYSAFEKRVLYPMITTLYRQGKITEEQVSLVLSLNFHSTETRRSGERYIDHPMSVAKNVLKFANLFGFSEKQRALALMAALLHDVGEKSNFSMSSDLAEVVSDQLREVVCRLHKEEEDLYFSDYIPRCSDDVVSAFVKICDIFHNTNEANRGAVPSFKQAYVYPIAANYLLFKIQNSKSDLPIDEFVVQRGILSKDDFGTIKMYTHTNHKVDVSVVADTIPQLCNIIPVKNIFDKNAEAVTLDYAHLRRTKDFTLYSSPDV